VELKHYRSRSFTYYTSDVDTSNVTTPWTAGENLHTKYGGAQADEADGTNKIYLVKSETVLSATSGGGCCGGGGANGVTMTYLYMDLDQGATPAADEVTRLVVEDTEDAVGGERYRKIFGLNSQGHKLREIFIADPTQGTLTCWSQSTVLGTTGNELNQPIEERTPSAHTLV